MNIIPVVFEELEDSFDVCFENLQVVERQTDVEKYTGEYTVTPQPFDETVLDTHQKLLTDDITVLKIPYFETSNEHGNTVYIGGE